jgi:formate dehydrogenase iron-sulfur subunit
MASREHELSALHQTSDPPRGQLAELLRRLIYPFQRGEAPKPQTPTGFYTDTTVCIGCKACEVACKQWNQLPSDGFNWSGNSYDNTIASIAWRPLAIRPAQPAPLFKTSSRTFISRLTSATVARAA